MDDKKRVVFLTGNHPFLSASRSAVLAERVLCNKGVFLLHKKINPEIPLGLEGNKYAVLLRIKAAKTAGRHDFNDTVFESLF